MVPRKVTVVGCATLTVLATVVIVSRYVPVTPQCITAELLKDVQIDQPEELATIQSDLDGGDNLVSDYRVSEPKSIEDFFKYLHWTNREACELSVDFGGHFDRFNGIVSMDGQKTICLDKGVAPEPVSCIVYSFGINNDWSFDDKVAEFGCQVFAFDPSMKENDHQRSDKIQFFKTGLGTKDEESDSHGWKMRTFTTLRTELGHANQVIDILKMDIEGAEWSILKKMIREGALKQVKQLAVELHVGSYHSLGSFIRQHWRIMKDIEFAGFTRFASTINPFMNETIKATGKSEIMGYEIVWFNQKFKSS